MSFYVTRWWPMGIWEIFFTWTIHRSRNKKSNHVMCIMTIRKVLMSISQTSKPPFAKWSHRASICYYAIVKLSRRVHFAFQVRKGFPVVMVRWTNCTGVWTYAIKCHCIFVTTMHERHSRDSTSRGIMYFIKPFSLIEQSESFLRIGTLSNWVEVHEGGKMKTGEIAGKCYIWKTSPSSGTTRFCRGDGLASNNTLNNAIAHLMCVWPVGTVRPWWRSNRTRV